MSKIIRLLSIVTLFVACFISTSSCRNEPVKPLIIDPKGSIKPPKPTSGEYLRFKINSPNEVVLRSANLDPMTSVQDLLLLFYDTQSNNLRYLQEINSISGQEQLGNIVVKIQPDDYNLVVLANPSEQIRSLVYAGSPMSNISEAQPLKSKDLYNPNSKSLLMANDQGAITISKNSFKPQLSDVTAPIELSLEPSLARVLVYGTPSLGMGIKGNKPIKFVVNNLPAKVSLLRQLNTLSTGVEEHQGDQSSSTTRYAKSSMWDIWSRSVPVSSEGVASYTMEQLGADEMANVAHESISEYDASLESMSLYVKESTMPEKAFLKGIVPYVHIAYPYIPQGLNLSGDEGFISYRGKYYSESMAKAALTERNSNNPLYTLLRDNGISQENFNNRLGFSVNGINFYYQGYSYYTVFVHHFAQANSPYGRYGIVRGNEYRIQLLSISNLGNPTPILYSNDLSPLVENAIGRLNVRIRAIETRTQGVDI